MCVFIYKHTHNERPQKRACIRQKWIYSFNPVMVELAPSNRPDLEIELYDIPKGSQSALCKVAVVERKRKCAVNRIHG